MVRILFGDVIGGRLDRSTYLAYSGLLAFCVFLFLVYAMSTLLIDIGDLEAAKRALVGLRENMPYDFLLIGVLITLVQANLVIKRIRDTGLLVILCMAAAFLLYAVLPLTYFMGALEISLLALMLIPTHAFSQMSMA